MDSRFTSASSVEVFVAVLRSAPELFSKRLAECIFAFSTGGGGINCSGFFSPRDTSIEFLKAGTKKYKPVLIMSAMIALYMIASAQENLGPLNGLAEYAHFGLASPKSSKTTRKIIAIWYILQHPVYSLKKFNKIKND